ncbi:MAG: DUF3139 domain-containing protein [Planctomycetaceae bacterium]|jgi:hypothetical protein|nr:DUF3139 domain-containing protein [Planctomycetaceae bacterium]
MKKFIITICILIVLTIVVIFFGIFFSFIDIDKMQYGLRCWIRKDKTSDDVILDLSRKKPYNSDFVKVRIVFKDNPYKQKFSDAYTYDYIPYDSIFGYLGYYKQRYCMYILPAIKLTNENGEYRNDVLPFIHYYDRKEKKFIFKYAYHKFSINKDYEMLECNDVIVSLHNTKVVSIVMKQNEPLSIIADDINSFDPPFNVNDD